MLYSESADFLRQKMRYARSAVNRLRRVLRGPEPPLPPVARRASFSAVDSGQWYDRVLLNPSTVGELATSEATLRAVLRLLDTLAPDDYSKFVRDYYGEGLDRYGGAWVFADILSALTAASQLLRPERYLEIGVRRGRSMAAVLASCAECDVVGFDLWVEDYAGMTNPGPEFVREEMEKLSPTGRIELISGSSHETVPRYFREHPELYFDLITVDGDHTERGATADLRTVIPRLKLGGVLVFDDIAHPHHRELESVWEREVASTSEFRTWDFRELGFGVGIGVRVAVR